MSRDLSAANMSSFWLKAPWRSPAAIKPSPGVVTLIELSCWIFSMAVSGSPKRW